MDRTVQIFDSLERAQEADRRYYASLTPQERVDLLLEIIQRHNEGLGEAAQGFAIVYRVDELSRR